MALSDGPVHPLLVDGHTPLGACEPWAVMFSLPPRGEQAIAALRKYRVGGAPGQFAEARAIFSALILHMPEEAEAVVGLSNFHRLRAQSRGREAWRRRWDAGRSGRLSAPLTLRLNRLIEVAGAGLGQRCSRTAVVVSLMRQARHEDKDLWRRRFTSVLSEPASRAVPGFDEATPETVLRLVRPRPGPRPQRLAEVTI